MKTINRKIESPSCGRELEALTFAQKYHEWILDEFKPYLGSRVVEVGAGVGNFSRLLLQRSDVQQLSLIEPDPNLYQKLIASVKQDSRVQTENSILEEALNKVTGSFNTIFYVNVLEHIEYDKRELEYAYQILEPGGYLCIFVPAHDWLYGVIDEMVGHFRRYSMNQLKGLVHQAGFEVTKNINFDMAGVFPWWLLYRVFRRETFDASQVKVYDRFVVPIMRPIEQCIRPIIGKNILLVAQKPFD